MDLRDCLERSQERKTDPVIYHRPALDLRFEKLGSAIVSGGFNLPSRRVSAAVNRVSSVAGNFR